MEKEHGRAILAALNKVFNDIKSEELQIPESIAEESDEMLTEWDDIRDASELFSLLHESEFEDVDVFMVEVDQTVRKEGSIVKCLSTLEEKFRVFARPRNILYSFLE